MLTWQSSKYLLCLVATLCCYSKHAESHLWDRVWLHVDTREQWVGERVMVRDNHFLSTTRALINFSMMWKGLCFHLEADHERKAKWYYLEVLAQTFRSGPEADPGRLSCGRPSRTQRVDSQRDNTEWLKTTADAKGKSYASLIKTGWREEAGQKMGFDWELGGCD